MVFSSMVFLWVFLPIVFVLAFLIRKPKYQNILLVIASLIFYAWGEPKYVLLLLFSIVMNWLFGLAMDGFKRQKKLWLILNILANLGLLGYFKYSNLFISTVNRFLPGRELPLLSMTLPIGISFFTFQALSYTIDLYRGKFKVQKNLLHMALYMCLFPQLLSGPIVKYKDIYMELTDRTMTREKVALGFRRFLYGLGKKVIIANVLGEVVDTLYGLDPAVMGSAAAWCAAILYTLQIYYDFAGYSDMAIGTAQLFGFDYPENFNYPYISSSIQEFWRRWHISLSTWFRDYLYIPLGGNRKGKYRTYLNLWIVFAVTGFWHGARWTFLGWGLYHGFFMMIERMGFNKFLKKHPVFAHLYAIIVFTVGWVFFRAESIGQSLSIIKRMFLPWMYMQDQSGVMTLLTTKVLVTILIAVIGCGLFQSVFSTGKLAVAAKKWKYSLPEAIFCTLIFLYSILLLASNTYNAFIYFKF